MRTSIATIILAVIFLTSPAFSADKPIPLGTYGDWTANYFMEKGNKVCFMSSIPKKTKGAEGKRRGDVLLFVTHWPGDNEMDVVSVSAGYPYKKDSDATVKVGKKTFTLFTRGEMAWASDPETDKALSRAIQTGDRLTVAGMSSRGTKTTDTYSLKGSGKAYKAITTACRHSQS